MRRHVYGRRSLVPVFEYLRSRAIAGLYPGGDTYEATGELFVLDLVARRCDGRAVVLDVGANRGDYASLVLDRIPAVELHSFEPSEAAREAYRARVGDRARLHAFALGEIPGAAELHSAAPGDPTASLHGSGTGTPVEVRRLDDLGFDHVDLLKVDVEGHELAVLKGAEQTLDRTKAVQFEFGVANVESRTFFRDFFDLLSPAFDLHRLVRDGLVPLPRYEARYEVFTGANYLALRRAG